MIQPKITVGTVCYNAANCIENLIKSVMAQTYSNIEFVIIDGASQDGTLDILNKYKSNIDILVSEPDKGIYDAMNKLLKKATGDYLLFMGADDVFYDNEVIAKIASNMKETTSVYYGSVILKGLGTKHWGKFNKIKWATTNVCHQAIFYPRCVYVTYEYDIRYKIYADYAYNLHLLRNNTTFKYINIVTVLYNMDGVSSKNKDILFEHDYKSMVIKAVGLIPYYIGKFIRNIYFLKEKMIHNESLD